MKAYEIARAFADNFAADDVVPGAFCFLGQSSETIVLPALIFAVTVRALNGTGSALAYTLTVWIEHSADRTLPSDTDPAYEHSLAVELARNYLLGTGKAGLLQALNFGGGYGFDFRNWGSVDSDPGVEGNHFRTPIQIRGVALVL